MKLVEKHIVKDNRFEDICFKSGLLYNYVLYNVRQGIFNEEYLKEYEFSTKLCKENQFDFRNLPTAISQQVVTQVFSNIKGWIKAKKEFEKNPFKFRSKPKLPNYKKGEKQNMVVFTTSACRVKNGYIYFVKNIIQPIKTKIGDNKLCQVRIIPQATCYVVEVIYEKKEQDLNLNKDNVLSIDLGLNNLSSDFKMGKDFTIVGDWKFIIDENKGCGLVKVPKLYIYNSKTGLDIYINSNSIKNILSGIKGLNAVCSDGRVYDCNWNEISVKYGNMVDINSSFLIANSGNIFTKMAFKNLGIYNNQLLSKDDCIKAYNYLQTLKAK